MLYRPLSVVEVAEVVDLRAAPSGRGPLCGEGGRPPFSPIHQGGEAARRWNHWALLAPIGPVQTVTRMQSPAPPEPAHTARRDLCAPEIVCWGWESAPVTSCIHG